MLEPLSYPRSQFDQLARLARSARPSFRKCYSVFKDQWHRFVDCYLDISVSYVKNVSQSGSSIVSCPILAQNNDEARTNSHLASGGAGFTGSNIVAELVQRRARAGENVSYVLPRRLRKVA